MQGVILTFDPTTHEGAVISDSDRTTYNLASQALDHSIFRFLRQGQRVVFELDDAGLAINVRTGAEPDLKTSTADV